MKDDRDSRLLGLMLRTLLPVLPALMTAVVLFTETGCERRPDRPDIALIILDTMRRDIPRFEDTCTGEESLTPNLDRLAAGGTVFTNAWANAPWTVPSHVSLFTGLLPSGHGCTSRRPRFRTQEPTLAELLGRAGYETVSFYSNPWLTDQMTGMMRGFESQYVVESDRDGKMLHTGHQGGPKTLENIERWLDTRSRHRPFFMFVNLLEPHLPYDPPEEFREKYLGEYELDAQVSTAWAHEFNAGLHSQDEVDWHRISCFYAGDVYAADGLLGELIAILERGGLLDDMAVIVTSDHGENVGEHGFVDHQFGVYETLLAVPLVIRSQAMKRGVRSDPVMLTDLYETILETAGVSPHLDRPMSSSLIDTVFPGDRPLIAEYSGPPPSLIRHLAKLNPAVDTLALKPAYATVRVDRNRLTIGSDGSRRLQHPGNGSGSARLESRDESAMIESLEKYLPTHGETGEEIVVDEEMQSWLESLGYIVK